MKKILYIFLGLIAFGWLISMCGDAESNEEPATMVEDMDDESNVIHQAEDAILEAEEISNWNESTETDEMSGKKRYFNITRSTNELYFDFPYDGGSKFSLIVRNMNGRNEVLLSTNKGQFMSSYSGKVRLKFDENPPITVGYSDPSDASSGLIFLEASAKIISNLKKGKKLKLEAPFYQEGNQIIEFDIEGFEWSH